MRLKGPGKLGWVILGIAGLLILEGAAPSPQNGSEIPAISERINAFTFDLLKHNAAGEKTAGNVILSAQSIFHGLAMSYVASGGATRKELASVLHFPDDDAQLIKYLSNLRRELMPAEKDKKLEVRMANAAWLDSTCFNFREEYVDEIEKGFGAALRSAIFEKHEKEVSADINKWVSENTRDRIQRVTSPGDLGAKPNGDFPVLVTVNAVYFKADWASKFDNGGTAKRPFHVDSAKTEDTLMMHQKSLLRYSEDEQLKFLEIPYIGGSYSMYIVLPKETLTVRQMMDLVTVDRITKLAQGTWEYSVDVLLPKFEMKSHVGVKDEISKMGVKSAFDRSSADFDKMIVKVNPLSRVYISEIYHDAWINVHEEGTEAAAATTTVHFGCSASAQPRLQLFHVDHPFLFLIVHNGSRSILFAGWISRPSELALGGR